MISALGFWIRQTKPLSERLQTSIGDLAELVKTFAESLVQRTQLLFVLWETVGDSSEPPQ
jgi:hypothetical protein